MTNSKIIQEMGNIIRDIKLGNSFLFLGVFIILVSFYIQSENYTSLGLQIGLLTLVFGGVFRLLNIITKPFRNIEQKIEESETGTNKKIKYRDFKEIKHWKNTFRFTIWIPILMIYFIWINMILSDSFLKISIIPNLTIFIIFLIIIIVILIVITWYLYDKEKEN